MEECIKRILLFSFCCQIQIWIPSVVKVFEPWILILMDLSPTTLCTQLFPSISGHTGCAGIANSRRRYYLKWATWNRFLSVSPWHFLITTLSTDLNIVKMCEKKLSLCLWLELFREWVSKTFNVFIFSTSRQNFHRKQILFVKIFLVGIPVFCWKSFIGKITGSSWWFSGFNISLHKFACLLMEDS